MTIFYYLEYFSMRKNYKPAGRQWRIVSRSNGVALYAADLLPPCKPFSHDEADAHIYDDNDNQADKLRFWSVLAKFHKLDSDALAVEYI
jgi:hypothetical protein